VGNKYNFQVNLRGVIQLLSDHLYSGPHVFLREMLQNAVDAITARQRLEPDCEGEIRFEVMSQTGGPPTLIASDTGIGLTEDEVHQFLATIGESSKRDALNRQDFLGQFGIGLLSAFVVSEEIVVITRSARVAARTVEWKGRSDGTYTVRSLAHDMAPGTQVFLRAKQGCEQYFCGDFVRETTAHFGSHLPFPVDVVEGESRTRINTIPPWHREFGNRREQTEVFLQYGRETFGVDFLDAVSLRSAVGGVEGVAFVLPFTATLSGKRSHRVFLKNMFLSEQADNLLPEWAFFVRCVVNASDLKPTAAREAFYEDDRLADARDALGDCLRRYLIQLARDDRRLLNRIIELHFLPIKALAVEDDEFFRLFVDWLPFETSLGTMTLGEYFRERTTLRFVPTRDQFRQISGIAASQSLCVVNAGYTYDRDLLDKLPEVFPERQIEEMDATELAQNFDELSLAEREEVFSLVRLAELALQPYQCSVDIRKFAPEQLPALYTINDAATFLRSIDQTRDVADEHWEGLLESISADTQGAAQAQLCLNFRNPLVRRMARMRNRELAQRAIEMLYVQALLLGHYPLKAQEMKVLNQGLLSLIENALHDSDGPKP
jgi:molecular chaperone HtpG